MSSIRHRIAGTPISWGICDEPGWGWQAPAERVLTQMHEIGLSATEYGPKGFLPEDPVERSRLLERHDLTGVGQVLPLLLHHPEHDPLPEAMAAMGSLTRSGSRVLVVTAVSGRTGDARRARLDESGWQILLANLNRLAALAQEWGVLATLQPRVDTLASTAPDAERVLRGSTIDLTLDTGHLLIAGGDPVAFVERHAGRIAHCHLKDVRAIMGQRVRNGDLPYAAAVRSGLYLPLGAGDLDVEAIVHALERARYAGWYVLEQDIALDADPLEPRGGRKDAPDPAEDAQASLEHLLTAAGQDDAGGAVRT
ncbi:MAG: sugar phosphate isomerase/epimerase [Micrococcales bacterium]|nr:sugar phosphate isomerase/epimerase [Micrococcales bacterium]